MGNFIFSCSGRTLRWGKVTAFSKNFVNFPQQNVFPEESFTCRTILVKTAFFILQPDFFFFPPVSLSEELCELDEKWFASKKIKLVFV